MNPGDTVLAELNAGILEGIYKCTLVSLDPSNLATVQLRDGRIFSNIPIDKIQLFGPGRGHGHAAARGPVVLPAPPLLRHHFVAPGHDAPDDPIISHTLSFQHGQMDCFAHVATHLIYHNVYRRTLSPEDTRVYVRNNCNQYLDTTKTLTSMADYATLVRNCTEQGAANVILFRYIYFVITSPSAGAMGRNMGTVQQSVRAYLISDLPEFPGEAARKRVLRPILTMDRRNFHYSSIIHSSFLSRPVMVDLIKRMLAAGFYFALRIRSDVGHFVTVVGIINTDLQVKDPWSQVGSLISMDRLFRQTGDQHDITHIDFLYNPATVTLTPEQVAFLMAYNLQLYTGGKTKRKRPKKIKKSVRYV